MADSSYPGEGANGAQIMALASEYANAARSQMDRRRKGEPLSNAPARLLAIHAIELYLNAALLTLGHSAGQVRGMQHNLEQRSQTVRDALKLRKRTCAHLAALTDNREYLISRYGPEMTTDLSQINRLMATLEELESKVLAISEPMARKVS